MASPTRASRPASGGLCLVTGGCGFIGRHVVRRLLADGCRVRTLDRVAIGPGEAAIPTVHQIQGDLGDPACLNRALDGVDQVIHLACSTVPRTSEADPAGDAAVNLVGTLNLLARCAAAGVHRLLLASSGGTVYGLAERTPIDERHPTRPCSAHGALKLALEGYAGAFRASRGLDTVILRVANAYGTGQDPTRPQGIVAIFLDRLLRDEPIRLEGDGAAMRDFVHVEDVADAFARARCADLRDRIFNIGTGRGATVREVLARIERETGQQARIEVSPANPCDVPVNVLDCSRARDQLGWSPALDLAEGIRRTVADRIGHAPPARRDGTPRGAESPAG